MSVFDSAMSTLIDVMHAADGKLITLHGPSGDVVLTALYRREPADYPGGDGMGGGWQLVAKTSAIETIGCASLRGIAITVDDTAHTITGTRTEDGGLTIIELGYGS